MQEQKRFLIRALIGGAAGVALAALCHKALFSPGFSAPALCQPLIDLVGDGAAMVITYLLCFALGAAVGLATLPFADEGRHWWSSPWATSPSPLGSAPCCWGCASGCGSGPPGCWAWDCWLCFMFWSGWPGGWAGTPRRTGLRKNAGPGPSPLPVPLAGDSALPALCPGVVLGRSRSDTAAGSGGRASALRPAAALRVAASGRLGLRADSGAAARAVPPVCHSLRPAVSAHRVYFV